VNTLYKIPKLVKVFGVSLWLNKKNQLKISSWTLLLTPQVCLIKLWKHKNNFGYLVKNTFLINMFPLIKNQETCVCGVIFHFPNKNKENLFFFVLQFFK